MLGKRYIAVVCHPERSDQSEWIVSTLRDKEGDVYTPRNPYGCDCDQRHEIRKLVVDLDDLPAIPESPDERLQRVERCMLQLTAEWLQLTGRAEPPVPKGELERMRDVVEAMRPIVDAARDWAKGPAGDDAFERRAAQDLHKVIVANRDRVGDALSAWENSGTWSEAEKLQQRVENLRPAAEAWLAQPFAERATRQEAGLALALHDLFGTEPLADIVGTPRPVHDPDGRCAGRNCSYEPGARWDCEYGEHP